MIRSQPNPIAELALGKVDPLSSRLEDGAKGLMLPHPDRLGGSNPLPCANMCYFILPNMYSLVFGNYKAPIPSGKAPPFS
jgi:hypothetical protein